MADAVRAAAFQEVESTMDVHLTVGEGALDRGTHTGHGGEMDNQIDKLFLEEALQQRKILDVAWSAAQASGCLRHA
jgi:hypothetical protein